MTDQLTVQLADKMVVTSDCHICIIAASVIRIIVSERKKTVTVTVPVQLRLVALDTIIVLPYLLTVRFVYFRCQYTFKIVYFISMASFSTAPFGSLV